MSSYIDTTALWHVALYGVLFGAGTVLCYALGIVGSSRLAVARERGDAKIAAPALLAAVSFAAVAAALAFGLFVMFDK
jgi:threonine/homoserine efflux transporter RhtA